MRGQAVVISSYLAVVITVLLTIFYMVFVLPHSTTRLEVKSLALDVYQLIESRGNWTAEDLANELLRQYQFEYVNVSITTYSIVENSRVVSRDFAVYRPAGVSISSLIVNRYSYSVLYRNGHYKQYLIEVGFR